MQFLVVRCINATMTWLDRALLFSPSDYVGLAWLGLSWLLIGWVIEHPPKKHPSTSKLMSEYRRAWMQEMITREPRIFDAQIVASLRQGTAFFASTAVLALGGVLALLGNAERWTMLAGELIQNEAPLFVWEAKLGVVLVFLLNAFLKFVWANRLFGYVSVVMAAVPNDLKDALCQKRADQAAEMNILAAMSFNRGLRSTYFALAATAWLAGPWLLIIATMLTLGVIFRREFASRARQVLLK
jgi:uncharacterized membrane protein